MNVLMMPDYRVDNPYQSLLAHSLNLIGTNVEFPQGYRRIFPIWRAIKQSDKKIHALHLHWINPYTKGHQLWIKLIYSIKFLIDIILVKLSGTQITWTVHNLISHEVQFPKLEYYIQAFLLRLVDHLIVHDENAKSALVQLYKLNLDRVSVVPHGHYRDVYGQSTDKISARKKLDLPLHDLIYLNFGMLRPYKGIESLLVAWKEYSSLEQATLIIAGKPNTSSYEKNLKNTISNSEKVVLHAQYIEDEDVATYFSAADIVVLPFTNILTSGSLLLAMSFNKPVITPKMNGIPEILGPADTLLYDPQDDEGLKNILYKSTQINIEKLSHLTMEQCQLFSWDAIAQKTQEIYNSN
ncbi:MAG: glycosyltransferase [Symploca sp. SIO2B6]|nr:glycosyltransferase [Symploca sp. SIO2B6]